MKFDDPEAISLQEASKVVPGNISVKTLNHWVRVGRGGIKLQALKIGNRYYTTRGHLQEFFETVSRLALGQPAESEEQIDRELVSLHDRIANLGKR